MDLQDEIAVLKKMSDRIVNVDAFREEYHDTYKVEEGHIVRFCIHRHYSHEWVDIPEEIGELIYLKIFDLSDTSIKSIPESILQLKNLTHLAFFESIFCDQVPNPSDLLAKMLNTLPIESFNIGESGIDEHRILKKINNSKLKYLGLDSMLEGKIPKSLLNNPDLEKLSMVNCGLTDLPSWLSKLTKLKVLRLTSNNFKKVPKVLKKMPNLRELTISNHCTSRLLALPEWILNLNPQFVQNEKDKKSVIRLSEVPLKKQLCDQIKVLKTKVEEEPNNPEAWYQLGIAVNRLGVADHTYEENSEYFLKAIELDSDHVKSWFKLVCQIKDLEQRIAYLKQILEIEPNHRLAKDMLRRIENKLLDNYNI